MVSYKMSKKRLSADNGIHISDTTIRDGWQMPGIHMTEAQKVRIYEFLHRIGIEKLECFLFSDSDKNVALGMLERGYNKPVVTGWARARKEDIDEVLKVEGVGEVGILMSVSDIHVFKKIGFASRNEAEESYLSAMDYALDKGLKVRCHLEDVTRADFKGFVIPFVGKIMERDPDAIIRVCDTVGIALPDPDMEPPRGVPKTITALKGIGVKNIETHMHDDLGNSLANSLIGFDYGANWTSATFLGIGERAGNAELEKILMNLRYTEGLENKYYIGCLSEFAEFMEKEVGIFVPRNKAVVGKNVFTHESGIHAAAVTKDPVIYEPFPPEMVGGRRRLMIGPTSGSEIIAFKVNEILQDIGTDLRVKKSDKRIKAIYEEIQQIYQRGDRREATSISYDEMRRLVEKNLGM